MLEQQCAQDKRAAYLTLVLLELLFIRMLSLSQATIATFREKVQGTTGF